MPGVIVVLLFCTKSYVNGLVTVQPLAVNLVLLRLTSPACNAFKVQLPKLPTFRFRVR